MNIVGLYGAFDWNANLEHAQSEDDVKGEHWSHDAGCSLFIDGKHICSLNEERLSKIKYDGDFPRKSIKVCLEQGGIDSDEVDFVYHVPTCHFISLEQLENGVAENLLRKEFPNAEIKFIGHHFCHAASTVFTSPFNEGTFLTIDGGGSAIQDPIRDYIDYIENSSIGYFNKEKGIFRFYNMLENEYNNFGNLYQQLSSLIYNEVSPVVGWSAINASTGRIMGLSAYGSKYEKCYEVTDYSLPYINFDFKKLADSVRSMSLEDGAHFLQKNFENGMLDFITALRKNHLDGNVCFAGGSFLNVLTNSLIRDSGLFDNIHIPPFTDDAGLSFGAAIWGCYEHGEEISIPDNIALLGPEYSNEEILKYLDMFDLSYKEYDVDLVVDRVKDNKIIAWFQGRSEYGPRALGSRSIFMSPTKAENKDILNKRVKHRDHWRPFAGITLEGRGYNSPYMLYAEQVLTDDIPAITHEDNTCRMQTVTYEQNSKVYELLTKLEPPVILNTSFNDSGEPIVETPYQAIRSFMKMDIDCLVIGDFIVDK